jgi:hypothetical protein
MLVLKIIPLSLDWCTIYFALLFTRSINPDILMILSLLWRCATFPMITKNIWHEWNNCKCFFKIMNFIGLYDLQETFRIILLNHSQSALQFLVYRCIIGKLWWFVMFFSSCSILSWVFFFNVININILMFLTMQNYIITLICYIFSSCSSF